MLLLIHELLITALTSKIRSNSNSGNYRYLHLTVYSDVILAGVSLFHDGRYTNHTLPLFRFSDVYCSGRETNISSCSLGRATCPQKCAGSEMGLKCDFGEDP